MIGKNKMPITFQVELGLLMEKKLDQIKAKKETVAVDLSFDWVTFPELSKTEQVK
jgi:hypothetical protein